MNESIWLDELFTVCSPANMSILKFLWSQNNPIDTHAIAKGTHMSMEEVYYNLQALEKQKIVKMQRSKTKNESRRVWCTIVNSFTILIKAEKGDFNYKSNIKQKSLKILDVINDKVISKKEKSIEKEMNVLPSTKIKIKHKDGNLELEGSESFVEKRWKELKTTVKQVPKLSKKKKPAKKSTIRSKKKDSKRQK